MSSGAVHSTTCGSGSSVGTYHAVVVVVVVGANNNNNMVLVVVVVGRMCNGIGGCRGNGGGRLRGSAPHSCCLHWRWLAVSR